MSLQLQNKIKVSFFIYLYFSLIKKIKDLTMKTLAPSSVHLPLFLIKFCHSQKLNFLRTLPGENKQTSLLETLEKKIIKQITNYVWFQTSLWTLCAIYALLCSCFYFFYKRFKAILSRQPPLNCLLNLSITNYHICMVAPKEYCCTVV